MTTENSRLHAFKAHATRQVERLANIEEHLRLAAVGLQAMQGAFGPSPAEVIRLHANIYTRLQQERAVLANVTKAIADEEFRAAEEAEHRRLSADEGTP